MNWYNNTVDKKKLTALLKTRKTITVDNNLIKKVLGYDDMRDFVKDLGDWGHCMDFTYQAEPDDFQRFLSRFLRDEILEENEE